MLCVCGLMGESRTQLTSIIGEHHHPSKNYLWLSYLWILILYFPVSTVYAHISCLVMNKWDITDGTVILYKWHLYSLPLLRRRESNITDYGCSSVTDKGNSDSSSYAAPCASSTNTRWSNDAIFYIKAVNSNHACSTHNCDIPYTHRRLDIRYQLLLWMDGWMDGHSILAMGEAVFHIQQGFVWTWWASYMVRGKRGKNSLSDYSLPLMKDSATRLPTSSCQPCWNLKHYPQTKTEIGTTLYILACAVQRWCIDWEKA